MIVTVCSSRLSVQSAGVIFRYRETLSYLEIWKWIILNWFPDRFPDEFSDGTCMLYVAAVNEVERLQHVGFCS